MDPLDALLRLIERMREPQPLEGLMQLIADSTAEIVGAKRVSVRLLDPTRTSLISVGRAGQPLHQRPAGFRTGEGLIGWIVEHGQAIRVGEAELDPRFASRPGMEKMGAFLGAPICAGAECTGVISVVDPNATFDERQEKLVVLVAALCGPYLEIARLSRLSRVDPLTGALNRRGLDLAFPQLGDDDVVSPLSAVMIDVDHFKRFNDTYGHATGDLVLREVAAVCGDTVREGDAVVRYGGEEFVLLLPHVDRAQAARIAERVRSAVAMGTTIDGQRVTVTISAGVAERVAGESRDALLARADAALYRAKQAGRDRVEVAD